MIESIPPGMLLIVGALLIPLLRGRALQIYMLALPVLGVWHITLIPDGHTVTFLLFDTWQVTPLRNDRLSRVWGYIFHLATFLSVIYALHVKDKVQHTSALMYAGAAICAVFVGDLISLFVFWELTAVTSVFLIWARRTERAYRVGLRYLVIQVTSGVVLLAGVIMHAHDTGSVAFVDLVGEGGVIKSAGVWLIFLGIGVKAAFPFLHAWLQDAYPEATPTGTVFLSAFTTKLAIYTLARAFPGTDILIPIGCVMTVFPVFFAVIENDLRRVLSFSLNNQLGFMIVGIGIGTELTINGAAGHAFAHILYKALLFMSMGAVLHRVGTVKASELGGLWRSMPWTTGFCIIGAMSISAFPLFSGFVTKSMVLGGAAEGHLMVTFLILTFASAGVLEHSGIKVPYFAFFAHDSGKRCEEAPLNMLVAMGITAALCIGIGVYPAALYSILPYDTAGFSAYDTTHVVTQMQLLLFAIVAFVFLQKWKLYPAEMRSTVLNVDWLYRKLGLGLTRWVWWFGGRVNDWATGIARRGLERFLSTVALHHRPGGALGEPWPTGSAAMWAAVLLYAYMVLAFW